MAPLPQESGDHGQPPTNTTWTGDEVVITGISGLYPSSDSAQEFAENLFNKVDMVTENDLNFYHPEAPKHLGKINGTTKFDAQFFKIVYNQAATMDPMNRKLLEQAYMAMYDSGMNPLSYKGRKLGVFIGSSYTDTSNTLLYSKFKNSGNAVSGCAKTMLSNRISFWIDGKGPSYTLDAACTSSMICLEHAFNSLTRGDCDAAIVGGCNLCLEPKLGLNLRKCGLASIDGKTKCFDKNSDGFVRAEAISCIFLQKAKEAKRVYAEVCYATTSFMALNNYNVLQSRQAKEIEDFLNDFYSNVNISPKEVEYVEANAAASNFYATATVEADANELEAISNIFWKDRPVKVGSVKSNMGSSEAASGICAISKVCLAYHLGKLPANLHFETPLDIPAINDGKIKIVQDTIEFKRGYVAVNNFSFLGSNCHVLLKGHFKPKDISKYKCNIPHLVLISARKDESVEKIINILKSQPLDPEVIGMLHNIYKVETPGHTARGFAILDTNENNETICLSQSAEYNSGSRPPLWLVFSGMGSQWPGMAADLMKIPTFAKVMHRCHNALEPLGINLIRVLTEPDKTIFDNILHCFIGIAAVQIGLTDILKEIGIVPDFMIGHSQGEMGVAYFDNCVTAEDMILAVYSRGMVSLETKFIDGAMAAVGLGYDKSSVFTFLFGLDSGAFIEFKIHFENSVLQRLHFAVHKFCHKSITPSKIKSSSTHNTVAVYASVATTQSVLKLLPPEIDVACHNSNESATLSGPATIVSNFIKELSDKGIFAKEVPCANIAFHSRYIKHAGPSLFEKLKKIIIDPPLRSEKWVSTSVPQERWNETAAKYSSAEYHTNNLLSPVLFEESARLIPYNAVIVEVAPHGLLQAILKRSHPECVHIPLTKRGHPNQLKFFFEALGKIYEKGFNFNMAPLYPKIDYPVATETQLLSHFVDWEHSEDWLIYKKDKEDNNIKSKSREFAINIHDDEYKFLNGHIREGKNVFPEAGVIKVVWETLAMYTGVDYKEQSVILRNVQFYGEVIIAPEKCNTLNVVLNKGNDYFEVTINDVLLANGYIAFISQPTFDKLIDEETDEENVVKVNSTDVYKCLLVKGYNYKNEFQSIKETNFNHTEASVQWNNNWITFVDSLIQLNILSRGYEGVAIPKIINYISICTKRQNNLNDNYMQAKIYKSNGITRCGGVEMKDIIFENKVSENEQPDVLEGLTFAPHFIVGDVNLQTAIHLNLQLVTENISENNLNIIEITTGNSPILSDVIKTVENKLPNIDVNFKAISLNNIDDTITQCQLIVVQDLLTNEKDIQHLLYGVNDNTFILAIDENVSNFKNGHFNVLSSMRVQGKNFQLLRKINTSRRETTFVKIDCEDNFAWLPKVKDELQKIKRVVMVSERQPHCGSLGLVKQVAKQFNNQLSLFVIDDYQAISFDLEKPFYKDQLSKNLTFNVYLKGQWGSYYYLPVSSLLNAHLNYKLINSKLGDIDSLQWAEIPSLPTTSKTVQVCYAGPSQKDSKKAINILNGEQNGFGMDFSGFNSNGERVMGLIPDGAIASTIQADSDLLWPVPKHWTLEEAATVPLPYVHAYYCLVIKSQLLSHHSVFINGGAGALGQAVISVCLSLNCKVFTSVSDESKKRFLMKSFPQLDEKHIGCSLNGDHYAMVVNNTNGRKCDIVINCGSGRSRKETMKCVSGRSLILNINDYDCIVNDTIGMSFFEREKSFIGVNLSSLFLPQASREKKILQTVLAQGISNGTVRPLSRVVYPTTEVSRAFRLLTANKHRGRVLIKIKDAEISTKTLNIIPRIYCSSKATYIVISDESILGTELTHRLVQRGARKLVLHLKTKSVSGYVHTRIAHWRKLGATIKISTEILHSNMKCTELLKDAEKMGRVQGIFIIQESSAKNSWSREDFIDKYDHSTGIVANLDILSRNYCPKLTTFAVISRSSKNVIDEFSTSVSDKICQTRLAVGLPALSFRIELMTEFTESSTSKGKLKPQNISTVLNALEGSLKQKYSSCVTTFNLKSQPQSDFLEKVARCLGVQNISDIEETATVGDLIVNDISIEELRMLIKNSYDKILTGNDLRNTTIFSLKTLTSTNNQVDNKKNFTCGLGAFYTKVKENEFDATDVMVPVRTLLDTEPESLELDETEAHLMLIPGFDGQHEVFNSICKLLKIKAMAFQIGPDKVSESISDMAQITLKYIKKSFVFKTTFYLMGYSFGVNVALEVASLLEKEGHKGIVFCLDSSPDALKAQLSAYIGNKTDNELQNLIFTHFSHLMCKIHIGEQLKEELRALNSWSDKLDLFVDISKKYNVKLSSQYKRDILDSTYQRLRAAKSYKAQFKLNSEIILIKGTPHPQSLNLEDDYGLSKYTSVPVKVFDIEADHSNAPYDYNVPNIVNKFLEQGLLETFKSKNLCKSYKVNL